MDEEAAVVLSAGISRSSSTWRRRTNPREQDDSGFSSMRSGRRIRPRPTQIGCCDRQRGEGQKYPAIYVLPVEAGTRAATGTGEGGQECSTSTISRGGVRGPDVLPPAVYADHPTKPEVPPRDLLPQRWSSIHDKTYRCGPEAEGRSFSGSASRVGGRGHSCCGTPTGFGRRSAWTPA